MGKMNLNILQEEVDRCLLCKKPRCRANCPIETPIPDIIGLFKEGKIEEAGEILFNNNPLSAACGIICPHEDQCLGNCIKGIKSDPVKFHELETQISSQYLKNTKFNQELKLNDKVAIIGSGPAGITMAFILAKKGYKVTIFEKNSEIGGVLRYGIPDFRLNREILDNLEERLLDLNVKIRYNALIGPILAKEGEDALFVNAQGQKFTRQGLWKVIKKYANKANISKNINPSILRHSFAIHLLKGGANVAVVGKILGNSNLSSLQLYLNQMDNNIRKEIKDKHPRKKEDL